MDETTNPLPADRPVAPLRRIAAVVATLAVLAGVNWTIVQRERLVSSGRVVLLELAPVDPRSLMQGDYMALRFAIAREAFHAIDADGRMTPGHGEDGARDGWIVADLDEHGVAHFGRFADRAAGRATAGPSQILLRYRVRDGQPKFATNAFFFEEGQADRYASARYGEFRVAPDGEMILTDLRDGTRQRLGEPRR